MVVASLHLAGFAGRASESLHRRERPIAVGQLSSQFAARLDQTRPIAGGVTSALPHGSGHRSRFVGKDEFWRPKVSERMPGRARQGQERAGNRMRRGAACVRVAVCWQGVCANEQRRCERQLNTGPSRSMRESRRHASARPAPKEQSSPTISQVRVPHRTGHSEKQNSAPTRRGSSRPR